LPAKRPLPPAPGQKGIIPRTRQDAVERPITSPSTTDAIPPPGEVQADTGEPAVDDQALQQQAAVPIPGAEEEGSGAAQGEPGLGVPLNETGLPMTRQEQQGLTSEEIQAARGDTSSFLSDQEANEAIEDKRMRQPSPVEGIPQGTYEKVVKEPSFSGNVRMSAEKMQEWKDDAREQLSSFGDFPGKNDPHAPPPPIRPFGRSFNPFTGQFTGEKAPSAFKLMGIDFEALKKEFYRTGGRS